MRIKPGKSMWIIAGTAFALAAICILQMLRPKEQYAYAPEHAAVFEEGNAVQGQVIYENISLKPGVYRVALAYETDTDQQNSCKVFDNTVFYGGLLSNEQVFYQGLSETDFYIWLFESTDALQVAVSYGGTGSLQLGGLLIEETNGLWSMLLTIILAAAAAILGIMYLRLYDRAKGISKEKKEVALGLTVIVLLASLPYLHGFNISGADLTYHLQRIEGVMDGWLSGQFPVRLEPEWVHGHGYANAIFYCNALLTFPALLRLMGFTVMTSFNLYCIALNIATAWIAYYCFSGIFKDRYIGIFCSALYTLSIFRIYKLVIVSAVGEGSAFTFLPLILYGFYRALTENPGDKGYKTVWIPLTFGYAGLLQTHVLTCEITVFLTIIVCLVWIRKVLRRRTFLELAKGAGGAILLSLWFLVPFLDFYLREDVHIKHVSARTIQDRGIYLAQLAFNWWKSGGNALLGELGMQYSHPMGVGLVLMTGFLVFIVFWFSGKWRTERHPVIFLGKAAALFGGMLMLMSLEIFPWDRIQSLHPVAASLVSSIQFPNRFLGWGTCFLTAVAGSLLWYFRQHGDRRGYYLGTVCVLAGIATSSLYLTDYVCSGSNIYQIYDPGAMGRGYISGAEYLLEGTDEAALFYKGPVPGAGVEISFYEKKYLHVRMECKNTGGTESYVELPLLYYDGYQAWLADSGEKLETGKGDNNVVRVWIPAGFDGSVEVEFVSPVYWRVSEILSYAGWIAVIAACVSCLCKRSLRGEGKKCVL